MFVLFLFALACNAVNYSVVIGYPGDDSTCTGPYTSFVANDFGSCSSTFACACSGGVCSKGVCLDAIPADPPNAIVSAGYARGSDCTGNPTFYTASSSGNCVPNSVAGTSFKDVCDGSYTHSEYTGLICDGTPTSSSSIPYDGSPVCIGGQQYLACNGVKCFHKDSTIKVNGKAMTYDDFKAEGSPCAIPHEMEANGIKIKTKCEGELRLTAEHLVMTPEGFKKAGSLAVGDFIHSQIEGPADCEIVEITAEIRQTYYGLNCENSHVECDGYWVSTFGITHDIPSMWMNVASKVVGVKLASKIGDFVAQNLNALGLI